jgi:hypothetical protein
VVQEAQYKCSYNVSFAALDEAKGTLLADCKIALVDATAPRGAAKAPEMVVTPRVKARPDARAIDVDFDVKPAALPKPDEPRREVRPASPSPTLGGRAIRYDISLEGGPLPIQLKGTVSFGPPAGHDSGGR